MGASARSYDGYGRHYDDGLPWGSAWRDCYDCYSQWHILRDGFYGGPRLERSAYGFRPEANLVVSRQCVGFTLPPNALHFLGYETAAYMRWRVDDRNVRYGTFAVRQKSNGIDLCATDTIVKNWEKRFAKDVMGTGDGDLFVALGGFFGKSSKTPIGQAVIAGVNKGVFDLVRIVGARPAEGSIVKAQSGRVWLNLGQGAVSVGDRLEALRKGEALIDPETGISLGTEDTAVGSATVAEVQEKFSIARLEGSPRVKRSDKVVSMEVLPSIEFADSWAPPERPQRFKRKKKDKRS